MYRMDEYRPGKFRRRKIRRSEDGVSEGSCSFGIGEEDVFPGEMALELGVWFPKSICDS